MTLDKAKLQQLFDAGIRYLQQSQDKHDLGEQHFAGEWPSRIECIADTFIGKAGKTSPDYNVFTTALVHNILAETYLRGFASDVTPEILTRSLEAFPDYSEGDAYNFWHTLPTPFKKDGETITVTRPSEFKLEFNDNYLPITAMFTDRTVYAGTNIPPDSDDTAVVYVARKYGEEICQQFEPRKDHIGPLFSAYQNLPPVSEEYLRTIKGMESFGAFLVSFADDASSGVIPDTSFTSHYLPYGMNEADCVVNANILYALSLYNELDTSGVYEACNFINNSFLYGNARTCTYYYPGPYRLHYTAARAYANGATCLETAVQIAIEEIIAGQNSDGSWSSDLPQDTLHTTLLAISTLLYSGLSDEPAIGQSIEAGLKFILNSTDISNGETLNVEAGIMFSAGRERIRKDIVWRSEAYTTALIIEAISLYFTIDK